MVIQPTVGRIVWYYPPGKQDEPPLAAIITCVWSDICVNLAIFDKDGNPMHSPPTSVLLVQGEGYPAPNGERYCTWMPYQRGQAAKAEALEMQILSAK